jgi:hypothetical protein
MCADTALGVIVNASAFPAGLRTVNIELGVATVKSNDTKRHD